MRGDVVTVVLPGDFGKPRPAVILSPAVFADLPTVVVLPITSLVRPEVTFRIDVPADAATGLQVSSQVMAEAPMTIRREKVGAPIGRLDAQTMRRISTVLAILLLDE
ncbi:MAG: type II toxin-antitoxin system PemK/MazF family toxin [Rhizomicrobium sp.]